MAAPITELLTKIKTVRHNIEESVPRAVAQSMYDETMENFDKEQYGNDGNNQRWKDRVAVIRGKGAVNAEPYLRYKKLQYTGFLRRSITTNVHKLYKGAAAELRAAAPYAAEHNEGRGGLRTGNSFRRPPQSSQPLRLGMTPQQRQFMGIGSRTIKNVYRIYERELRRLL